MKVIPISARKVYVLSLGAVLLASVYPIYMGVVLLVSYLQHGGIDMADYPRYIIPYTPICISLIVCVAVLPLVFILCKKYTLLVVSILGAGLFLGAEALFEQVVVFTDYSSKMNIATWQLLSCFQTPRAEASLWDSLSLKYDPAFRVHFYAIALLIVLTVLGVICGFYKMALTQNHEKKRLLVVQLVSVVVFVGLCILACFTAFFRTGEVDLSPLSAFLMIVFFLIFGITAGVYTGTWLYGKKKWLSIVIPSVVAMPLTVVMYIGEMLMLGWSLFRYGRELFIFSPIGSCPLAPIDFVVVLLAGAITYFMCSALCNTDRVSSDAS